MASARWKLVSLWISQTARVTADNALRFFVCLEYASKGVDQQNSAWYLVNAIFTIPAVLFAPLNGAICNSLPKSRVLRWSAFYGAAVMAVFALWQQHWITCWALISIGSAIYGPTRYAMLPAASADTHWSLSRINGFIEMGTFSAILGGMILVIQMIGADLASYRELANYYPVIVLILILNAIAWITALPVAFPSDLRRDEPALQAIRGFFTDFRAIWNTREARYCLIGLSGKRGLVIGLSGAMLAIMFKDEERLDLFEIARITSWVAAGVAVGSLLAGLQKHPRRVLGLVPVGASGFTIGLAYAASFDRPDPWFCVIVGAAAGLINVPLASTYQAAVPDDARGNAMAVRNLTDYVCATVTALGLFFLSQYAGFNGPRQLALLAAISFMATCAAWYIYRREVMEHFFEFVFFVMYRFRVAGPGVDKFPLKGPVIVVVNHSGYMDPLWIGKVLPRTLVPMMTSLFYDHPALRWLIVNFLEAIRVQHSNFRRDVPELKVAVKALDNGKCIVIFPEGRLRRTEEQPLRLFGQGVWHILTERPNTPVVICWIEGGWGSYVSYFNGPPAKNKKFDIAHPISISIGEPHVLDAATLADLYKTRTYLMVQCGQLRKYLGLPAIELQQMEKETEEV